MTNPSTAEVNLFWRTLRIFWTEERVNQWCRAVFGNNDGTEKPKNLITLSPNAHKMHTRGYFALEPVELDSDRKKLTLCFWWLKQGQSAEEVSVRDVPDLTATYDPQGDRLGLLNMHTYRPLRSGDVIVLTTPDPDTHPLPDIRILEMQWVMNRITAMRGAAEPKDPFDSDSEDDSNSEGGDFPVVL